VDENQNEEVSNWKLDIRRDIISKTNATINKIYSSISNETFLILQDTFKCVVSENELKNNMSEQILLYVCDSLVRSIPQDKIKAYYYTKKMMMDKLKSQENQKEILDENEESINNDQSYFPEEDNGEDFDDYGYDENNEE